MKMKPKIKNKQKLHSFHDELGYGPLRGDDTLLLHEPPGRLKGRPPARFGRGALGRVQSYNAELGRGEVLATEVAPRCLEPLRLAPVGSVFECQMMITNATSIPAWEQSMVPTPGPLERDCLHAIRVGVAHHVAGHRHRLKHIAVSIGLRMPFDPDRAADDLTVFQALTESIERYYGALGMAPVRLRCQGILDHLAA